jgi:hypothetical protein
MKRLLAIVCVCVSLSAPRVAQAEILFDLDPNVPDVLSVEFTEAPNVPSAHVQATWDLSPDRGWDWTIVTLRPVPAGTFDLTRLTLAADSTLPTRIGAEWEYSNGAGGWGGPAIAVLSGETIDVGIERDRLDVLHVIFLSPQEGQNDLTIDTLRVSGIAHVIPEPSSIVSAVAAFAVAGLRWLIARRARRRSYRGPSRTF